MSAMPKLLPPLTPPRPPSPERPALMPEPPVAQVPPDSPPPVYRGDRIALLFWSVCALLIAMLLVKELVLGLLGLGAR